VLDVVHDSARRPDTVIASLRALLGRRGLVSVLVRRDLAVRYKRSLLGVWWTLLNPLLEMAVLWLVFSQVFRFATPEAPYVVYLLSGVVLATLLRQAVVGVATSLSNNATILARLYVPPEAFALSAAIVLAINFALSLGPLVVVMAITGTSIPLTLPLVVVPATLLLAGATGIGLLLAPASVVYPDVQELLRIVLTLLTYLAPVFYPIAIVPDRYQWVVEANPLTHFLEAFRALLYGASFDSWQTWAVMAGTAALSLVLGMRVFARSARAVVGSL
jgi:ABC-type polysaccharide/polyol phosphate export permease